ncbi:MAG: hypothetical protein WCF84_06605 [Anaerolineae bacterium]
MQSSDTLPLNMPPNSPRPLCYLALGDSYTMGERIAPQGRWPVQLALAHG